MPEGKCRGPTHAHDAGDIFSSSPAVSLLMAADDERAKRDPPPHIERSNALGCVKLMSRDRQQVDRAPFQMKRDFPRHLDRIHMKRNPPGLDDRSDLIDGKDDS